MTHLWIRSEHRSNEKRVGITPEGTASLINNGFQVTIEESKSRIFPTTEYLDAGCTVTKENSWRDAPKEAIIFGLKELPDDKTSLHHKHIMFGHAFKGQYAGLTLLKRFKSNGGILYDIEYLVNKSGKRVAAFGYWAGYAGAAVTLKVWLSQKRKHKCPSVTDYQDKESLINQIKHEIDISTEKKPKVIVIGALGRVGTGATDLCQALGIRVSKWDIKETARGGPFPEILDHDIFLNCIMATKEAPIFFSKSDVAIHRNLSVIGDIACDPDSNYNPIPIYNTTTTWENPSETIHNDPPLAVMAIDNLPSLLPKESSIDFASQLLPYLKELDNLDLGVWNRAAKVFRNNITGI